MSSRKKKNLTHPLGPRELAAEFADICGELDRRAEAAFAAGLDSDNFNKAVFYDDFPLLNLSKLLSFACGTHMFREHLKKSGFSSYGYGINDAPYGCWPPNIHIDFEKEKWGVFDPEQARDMEIEAIFFYWLVVAAKECCLGERARLDRRLRRWRSEFKELYCETYPEDIGEAIEMVKEARERQKLFFFSLRQEAF